MNESIRRRFDELKAGGLLPSPKGVALTVLELTSRQDASIPAVTHLVQADPAMTGRLLRYANASHGGSLRHIVSLQHAITFLGLFRVRQIALGFSLIDRYRSGACAAFDYASYWTTSLATGIAAQWVAPRAHCPPDESFTCGLLSGVGRLALATAFPEAYGEVLELGLADDLLAAEERRRFDIDHAALTAEMLASWGLPDIFTSAVRHHELPAASPFAAGSRAQALTAALHLSMRIGQLLNLDEARRWEQVPSLYNATAQLGMEAGEVPDLVAAVVNAWQAWGRELQLPTRAYPDLKALLAAPPLPAAEVRGVPQTALPLRVALLSGETARTRALADALDAMGLHVELATGWESAHHLLATAPPDVAVLDLPTAGDAAIHAVRRLRQESGSALHVIVLIADDAEQEVPRLMASGASDYLLQGYSEAALMARLSTAQRMVALQGAVRAERELVVSSSGEWARANRRLLQEALTDVLTQLPNRRYGLDRFAEEWSVTSSSGLPLACLMLDIDHFKQVNDRYGHEQGDMVLRQMAEVIEHSCRRGDVVFRYGGEEFCIICPSTTLDAARQLGQRILAAVRAHRFGAADAPFPLTVSAGIAVRRPDTASPEALIDRADQALYAAKAGGRDRIEAG